MTSESLRVGPFQLISPIGAGSLGEVFVAAPPRGPRVALKLVPALSDHAAVQRFFEAARTAARLKHPNVLAVEDVGESDGRLFVSMPLVEGISLARLIRLMRASQAQLPMPIVRLIAGAVLDALAFAHAREPVVLHGDVSPSNVLLSVRGDVLLADFGLADAARAEHQPRKKCAYLAPEQVRGGMLNAKADVFSAAVTLYETATLSSPFQHQGDADTMEAVVTRTQPSANTLRHEISERAALALDRALQKDPERRFGTVRQLRERFVDGEVATPAELADLVQTWAKDDLKVFHTPALVPSLPEETAGARSAPLSAPRSSLPMVLILVGAIAAAAGVMVWFRPVPPPPVLPLPPLPPPTPEPRPIDVVPVAPSEPIVAPAPPGPKL